MGTATVTKKIDERGRVTIPDDAREKLGIEGKEAIVEITLRTGDDTEE